MLRLPGLDSFPGVTADEGLWTNSSKNFVRFGDWFMDGRTHALLSPLYHALTVIVYTISEPSIAGARLVSALAGTLTTPLLYLLVRDATGRKDLALFTALFFGASAAYAFASRSAMIEPVQIALVTLAAWLMVRQDMRGALLGGIVFGLAMLAKLNVIFLGIVLPFFLLGNLSLSTAVRRKDMWLKTVVFGVAALAVAYGANMLLYLAEPTYFRRAYLFELEGAHFVERSGPVLNFGRFGLAPVYSAENVLELIRVGMFEMVFSITGAAIALVTRLRVPRAFWAWLLIGTVFVLIQTFQPIRYFSLVAPAYCFFAAVMVDSLRRSGRARAAVMCVYVLFNVVYLGMNAVANRDSRLQTIRDWMVDHVPETAPVVIAGYYATDLPHRAYAHYHLGGKTIDGLVPNLDRYGIEYVVWDEGEWLPEMRRALSERFETVADLGFAVVFRVNGPT